jgi:hypothetical protein
MTVIVNMWGGPGTGKSTITAQVFSQLKWAGANAELVTEAAKELVWEKHHNLLSDQFYVSAMQNRRLQRLVGQVDYIVTDSPLLLSAHYARDYPPDFHRFMEHVWNGYTNINFFLLRRKKYQPIGRMQDEAGAIAIDVELQRYLDENSFPYTKVAADHDAATLIKNMVLSK